MHNIAMEMGKWAMEIAKNHGFDNLSSQDWDDLKDCMEAVKCAICADKDYRIVEAMDKSGQEEKLASRTGYRPYLYMQDDDWMEEYLHNPNFEKNMYRMGYHPDRSDARTGDMNRLASKHGEIYDRYSDYRKHYHDSKDIDSKRKMDDSMKEYTSDIIHNLTEMWSDADATLRQAMKTDLTRLVQKMN